MHTIESGDPQRVWLRVSTIFLPYFLKKSNNLSQQEEEKRKCHRIKEKSYLYIHHVFYDGILDEHIQRIITYGGLSMESIKAGWLGFPIAYIFAMCCDWFFVSKIAKGFAFKYLVKPDSSVLRKVISVSCCMVVPMVIIMSLYGAVEVSIEMGNFSNLLIMWLTNIPKNFVMALPYQLIIAGPVVRFVFRAAFPEGKVLA